MILCDEAKLDVTVKVYTTCADEHTRKNTNREAKKTEKIGFLCAFDASSSLMRLPARSSGAPFPIPIHAVTLAQPSFFFSHPFSPLSQPLDFMKGEHKTPEMLEKNPLHVMPTYEVTSTPVADGRGELKLPTERHRAGQPERARVICSPRLLFSTSSCEPPLPPPPPQDANGVIWESNAIARYLANANKLDQWYPQEDVYAR